MSRTSRPWTECFDVEDLAVVRITELRNQGEKCSLHFARIGNGKWTAQITRADGRIEDVHGTTIGCWTTDGPIYEPYDAKCPNCGQVFELPGHEGPFDD